MLEIVDASPHLCDRVSRRAILKAGSLSALGLPGLGYSSQALSASPKVIGQAKRCILLFLLGGPPQHSTWDPKPDAPTEIQGEFGAISTNVPGIQVGELLPRTAAMTDKLAILRAVVTGDNAHSSSGYYMMTGVPHLPMNRENANPGPPNDSPTMGAIVSHLSQRSHTLPPAIRLPNHIYNTDGSVWPGQDSGWLGEAANPWLLSCQPAAPDFDIPHFRLSADVSIDRLGQRQALLQQLETQLRQSENQATFGGYSDQQQQAFNLLSSAQARAACDLSQESETVRDRYGRSQFGQSVLLARRFIETGVDFVQVNWFRGPEEPPDAPCWDSHARESLRLKTVLAPPFDLAFSALLEELDDRRMLDDTLVVCMAEFGRTPRFNKKGGRDHWGHVFSVVMAGGGIRGGQAYGMSDKHAAFPVDGIVHPEDVTATIFHTLGYRQETKLRDGFGRTVPISRGRIIESLL